MGSYEELIRVYGMPEKVYIDHVEVCSTKRDFQFLIRTARKKAASWLGKTRSSSWLAAIRNWV